MDTILILVIITLVFSVTVGLIIMNRDSIPEELMEELDNKEKEVKEEKRVSSNDTEIVITDDEII